MDPLTTTTARRRPRRRLIWVAVALVVLGIGTWFARHGAESLFYWPEDETHVYGTKTSYRIDAADTWFTAADGTRLHGWWLAAAGERVGTVVYCHGNHANLTLHTRFVRWLPTHGFDVLVFDYRGFGQSEGTPTRAGTVEDAIAAIDHALARDPHRTVVFGHSLGGAVGLVAVAQRSAVRAIAVEATFPSYRAVARTRSSILAPIVPWFVSAGFDPIDALERLPPRPLLVIHGDADIIVPFELGRELFDKASQPKQFHRARGAGHATPWLSEGQPFETMLVGFFRAAIDG